MQRPSRRVFLPDDLARLSVSWEGQLFRVQALVLRLSFQIRDELLSKRHSSPVEGAGMWHARRAQHTAHTGVSTSSPGSLLLAHRTQSPQEDANKSTADFRTQHAWGSSDAIGQSRSKATRLLSSGLPNTKACINARAVPSEGRARSSCLAQLIWRYRQTRQW